MQPNFYYQHRYNNTAMKRICYDGMNFVPYLENEKITARIRELGRQITEEYRGRRPVFICVLNGAFPFAADLFRQVETDAEIAFIRLSSYQGTESTGKVRKLMGLTTDITNRPVIIVEDIVDTGTTITNLVKELKSHNPSDMKVATLLFKPEALEHNVTPDYVGFEIPKKFIIGFGLDLDGLARNLRDIWVLDESAHDADGTH